jgi:hypothetical protein
MATAVFLKILCNFDRGVNLQLVTAGEGDGLRIKVWHDLNLAHVLYDLGTHFSKSSRFHV